MSTRWKEVEALYQLALRRKPADRLAFLDSVCSGEPELRAQVEALLGEATMTLSGFTGAQPDQATDSSSGLGPGSTLGPYRILNALGAGGMGQVFRGEDTRLGRLVAIKVLLAPSGRSRSLEARFAEEARAASALNHPNIVTIYDIGSADGMQYIVMELVEGQTLRDVVKAGPLPTNRLVPIAAQIAEALALAHSRGIVHRDLKPANLMLTLDNRVKILDFGLAKRIEGSRAQGLTVPGTVVGTCGYMSPEQARGEPIGFHSDQFSFGAVLYEMATGRRAFQGATEMDSLAAVIRDQPEPMAQINPQIPPPLQWAVERCLAKDPMVRYPSTEKLANELAALAAQSGGVRNKEAPAHNLPPQRTALVGREKELEELRQLLLLPSVRLVTLTGPGGIGKTRLCVEAGRLLLDQFPGGVYFVALEKITSVDLVPSEIAAVLKVRQPEERSTADALLDHLRQYFGTPSLLLVDNFEHVQGAAPLLRDLLDASDTVKVMVTSRAALRLYGEYDYPVPPLAAVDGTSPAVALFLDRAVGVRPEGRNDPEQLRLVSDICRRLDGLPLAIELAAARTKVLPLRALRDRLSAPLQLLAGGARDLPERQQALRATLDWSYNLLDPDCQKLFRRLAVFVGGATHEAIEAVCNAKEDLPLDFLDAISALVDNSLLRRSGGDADEPRFVMLDTMREYGLLRLREAGEEDYIRKAHAAYCLVLAEEGQGEIESANAYWYARFDAEIGNFRAALDWLEKAGETEWALRMAIALNGYWVVRGLTREAASRFAAVLALPAASARTKLRAEALACASDMLFLDPEQAAKLSRESLEIFRELGMKTGMLRVLNSSAVNERRLGNYAAARAGFEQCVEVARELGLLTVLAGTLSNLADVMRWQGDVTQARECYEESRRLFEVAGDRASVAWTLSHEADLLRDLGKLEAAHTLYKRVYSNFHALGHGLGMASSQFDLATIAGDRGDLPTALRLYREALKVYWALDHKSDLPRMFEALSACAVAAGQPQKSLMLAGCAAAMRQVTVQPLRGDAKARFDRSLDAARALLSGSTATETWIRGWNMPLDEAFQLAMSDA